MPALLALILPLALDTFAVGAALGASRPGRLERLRLALLLAAFEAGMPLVGLALGAPLSHAIGGAAEGVAIALLLALGLLALLGGEDDDAERLAGLARRRGAAVLALGVAVSLDELALGFALGLLHAPLAPVVAAIAVQAFVAAQLGLRVGARLGERLREGAERLAGGVLVALALGLLVHALAG